MAEVLASSAEVALCFEHVSRREKGVAEPLLNDVSFALHAGELVALVGADGAGKTTLMRAAAGILKPQDGVITLFGEGLYRKGGNAQTNIGYMPQKFGLYEDLSVLENFVLYADLFGLDAKARETRFAELFAMTNLTAFQARPAGKLSGGMKQKLGLACALLNRPKLLLLDEPSVGVDPLSRRELWTILKKNVGPGKMSALVATTYMDEASLCERVLLLEKGVLHHAAPPEEIAHMAAGRTCLVTKPNVKLRDLQARLSDESDVVLDAVPAARGVHVLLEDNITLERFAQRHPDCRVEATPPGLEDGYLVCRTKLLGRTKIDTGLSGESVAGEVSDPVISAKKIVRRFGSFTAVDRTSFNVHPGEIFGLLGPNGAGKTTTFRMLCGLIEVTDGELTVAGNDVRVSRAEARRRLGYMSQKFSLYGNLSVEENLEFFAEAYGLTKKETQTRVASLLAAFQLTLYRKKNADALSGGIRQRLAMAAALLHRPAILFLDEPTSGADVPTRRQFWRWMTELSANGTTIIVTTHFMEEAEYCDRLIIQDAGKTLVHGTPEEVLGDAATMDEAFVRIVQHFRAEANDSKAHQAK